MAQGPPKTLSPQVIPNLSVHFSILRMLAPRIVGGLDLCVSSLLRGHATYASMNTDKPFARSTMTSATYAAGTTSVSLAEVVCDLVVGRRDECVDVGKKLDQAKDDVKNIQKAAKKSGGGGKNSEPKPGLGEGGSVCASCQLAALSALPRRHPGHADSW
ncbi:unnamed protein product [Symbiodinium natans]|uniref:Uncharacterized protein n=1 Tax=Symbiodinium natans TaxID=878477 RepID=A0A812JUE9_9DINO|nr:unnamed protein product [Symbiodinium natans]